MKYVIKEPNDNIIIETNYLNEAVKKTVDYLYQDELSLEVIKGYKKTLVLSTKELIIKINNSTIDDERKQLALALVAKKEKISGIGHGDLRYKYLKNEQWVRDGLGVPDIVNNFFRPLEKNQLIKFLNNSKHSQKIKYWHMQLHPDDATIPKEHIQNILKTGYIGLGEWEMGKSQIEQFRNELSEDDIVLIRHPNNTVIALVQIIGEFEKIENPNPDLDWFENRREVKVLSWFNEKYPLPKKMGEGFYASTFQACKTFTGSVENINYTIGDYIKHWHRLIGNEKQIDNILGLYANLASQAISFKHCNISKQDLFYKERILFKGLVDEFLSNPDIDKFKFFWSSKYINSVQRKAVPDNILKFNNGLAGVKEKISFLTKLALLEKPQDSIEVLKKVFVNASYVTVEFFYTYNIEKDFFPLINNGTNNAVKILLKDTLYDKYSEFEKFIVLVDKLKKISLIYSSTSDDYIPYHYYLLDQLLNLIDKLAENEQPDISNKLVSNLYSSVKKMKFEKDKEMLKDKCELLRFQKQIILQGPPGTGKTRLAKQIARHIVNGEIEPKIDDYDEQIKLIQFHPSYSYEDFVRGIIATTTNDGSGVKYETQNKVLVDIAIKAKEDLGKEYYQYTTTKERKEEILKGSNKYILIIDEINRANLSSVLGELIYALEYRDESVESMYELDGNRDIVLPSNLYIIGTMNTADRSIGHIDYAIRRRFTFVDVLPDESEAHIDSKFKEVKKLFKNNEGKRADTLSPEFNPDDVMLGHSYFIADSNEELENKLNYQVIPLLKEYIKDGVLTESVLNERGELKIDKDS